MSVARSAPPRCDGSPAECGAERGARSRPCATAGPSAKLGPATRVGSEIVVHLVLVGVRVDPHRRDLVRLLVIEPGVDEVLGEDVALGEELVILPQGLERGFEGGGELRDVLVLGRRELVQILVDGAAGSMRRLIPSMPAMRQAAKER